MGNQSQKQKKGYTVKKQYRTKEQWDAIQTKAYNGNWSDAAKSCVKYGFYANDMINAAHEEDFFLEISDIAILAEMAMKKRLS